MYLKHYGLKKKPFELAPTGGSVFLSDAHREGIAILRYGVIADKGFLLLTGGVGTGKTTLLNTLIGELGENVKLCVLNNPKLTRNEFYSLLGVKLGFGPRGRKSDFILKFSEFLETCFSAGNKVLLIVDEAQAFSLDLLEEIRLLSNHAEGRNSLSIFLVGQPELQKKLASSLLLPLRQRIGVRYHLEPLTRAETGQYIAFRLQKAGAGNTSIFEDKAIDCIYAASKGTPRLINTICDHALILGFTREKLTIGKEDILECIEAIRLHGEEGLQVSPSIASGEAKSTLNARHFVAAIVIAVVIIFGMIGIVYLTR